MNRRLLRLAAALLAVVVVAAVAGQYRAFDRHRTDLDSLERQQLDLDERLARSNLELHLRAQAEYDAVAKRQMHDAGVREAMGRTVRARPSARS